MAQKVFLFIALLSFRVGILFAQMHVEGHFSIDPAAKVSISGDFFSETDILGEGVLMLNGSRPQQLGLNGHSVPVLEIKNPEGVSLLSNAGIGKTLVFTSGKIRLGNYDLLFAPGAGHSGAGADNYLVTDGSGMVRVLNLPSDASFTFPLGQSEAAADFTPLLVTNRAGSRTMNAQIKQTGASQAIMADTDHGIDRIWQISSDRSGPADIALTHKAGVEGSSFDNNTAFVIRQTGGNKTAWETGPAATNKDGGFTHSGSFMIPSGTICCFSKSSRLDEALATNNINSYDKPVLKVLPNPFETEASLKIMSMEALQAEYLLTDVSGKTVASGILLISRGVTLFQLPVQGLAPGAYVLHLNAGTRGQEYIKIIKQ